MKVHPRCKALARRNQKLRDKVKELQTAIELQAKHLATREEAIALDEKQFNSDKARIRRMIAQNMMQAMLTGMGGALSQPVAITAEIAVECGDALLKELEK